MVYVVVFDVVPPAACHLFIGFDIPDIVVLQIREVMTFGFPFQDLVGLFEAKGERLQVPQVIHVLAVIELIEISQCCVCLPVLHPRSPTTVRDRKAEEKSGDQCPLTDNTHTWDRKRSTNPSAQRCARSPPASQR